MNEDLRKQLLDAGVSEVAIAILEEEELTTEAALARGYTYEAFIAMKIKAGSARILADLYAPKFDAKSQTAASAAPPHVTVQMQKSVTEMNVGELLASLATNSSDDDLFDELTSRSQYLEALTKTDEVAVVAKSGGLDDKATGRYWQYLKRGAPQRQFNRQKTMSLEKALGRQEKELVHPLFEGETIYMGLDSFGNDWTDVDRERMRAAYWARTNGHRLFPANPDALDSFEELSAEKLSKRWQSILEDYREFVEDAGAQISLVVTGGGRNAQNAPFRREQSGRSSSRFEV